MKAEDWSYGDALRQEQELDNVHIRAYNKDKDDVVDEQFIGNDKAEADRIRDVVDSRAAQRGVNISAQTVKVRGGYKVITYTPKKKLCMRRAVSSASTVRRSMSSRFTSTAVAGLT